MAYFDRRRIYKYNKSTLLKKNKNQLYKELLIQYTSRGYDLGSVESYSVESIVEKLWSFNVGGYYEWKH